MNKGIIVIGGLLTRMAEVYSVNLKKFEALEDDNIIAMCQLVAMHLICCVVDSTFLVLTTVWSTLPTS